MDDPREFFESMMLEDGLDGAIEAVLSPGSPGGFDAVSLQLIAAQMLLSNVAERLGMDDPFNSDEPDRFFTADELACAANGSLDDWSGCPDANNTGQPADITGQPADTSEPAALVVGSEPSANETGPVSYVAGASPSAGETERASELTGAGRSTGDLAPDADLARSMVTMQRWEQLIADVHALVNRAGAVRAVGVARYARYDRPAGSPEISATPYQERPIGHCAQFAPDMLAPALGLGPFEAQSLVSESVWMSTRTPRLLGECVAGSANLATVAGIVRELQDASPGTCQLTEDAILARGIHRRTKRAAARSARALVTKHEEAAARRTAKKRLREQIGVWLDPHPTPGLATLSATMRTEHATELMDAIDARAAQRHRSSSEGGDDVASGEKPLLGECRADALLDMALLNVSVLAHLDFVVPVRGDHGRSGERQADSPPDGPAGSLDSPRGTGNSDPRTMGTDGAGVAGADEEGPPRNVGCEVADELVDNPSVAVDSVDGADSADEIPLAQLLEDGAMVFHPRSGALALRRLLDQLTDRRGRGSAKITTSTRSFDPVTWEFTDGKFSRSYRPPKAMHDRVARRDQRCRFPNCDRPDRHTDRDHVKPWPDGATADINLQSLCRRHHRAKQSGWTVTMTRGAVCTWTSPTERTYTTYPQVLETYADTFT